MQIVNSIPIIFFIILFSFIVYFSKNKLNKATNFFYGAIILTLLYNLVIPDIGGKADVILIVIFIFSYLFLYSSVFLIYLFKDYQDKFFFFFPTCFFLILLIIYNFYLNLNISTLLSFKIIFCQFLSFFPLLYYTYTRRK